MATKNNFTENPFIFLGVDTMTRMIILTCLLALGVGCKQKTKETVVEKPFPVPVEPAPPLPPSSPGFLGFDRFEQELIDDLTSLPEATRSRVIYVWNNQFNEGVGPAQLKKVEDGINFGINSLSTERLLARTTPIGNTNQIYRVDTQNYGLDRYKWGAISERLALPVFSNTIRGAQIRALTQRSTPWVYAPDLFLTSFTSPGLYYYLIDQPGQASVAQFLSEEGVNLQEDFDSLEGICAGYTNSQIALQKNRLVCGTDSVDGFLFSTYDTDSVRNEGDNLNETPFVVEARSGRTFVHDAQEHLYNSNNGLLQFRLNAAGVGAAEDAAPADVVLNRQAAAKGLSAVIDLMACSLCHFSGIIPVEDEMANHIRTTSAFDAGDKLRGENIFRQDGLDVKIRRANAIIKSALTELGISQFESDPLNNAVVDPLRLEQNIAQIAAIFFLTEEQFKQCLQSSDEAVLKVGNLLTGGSLKLESDDFQLIIEECNLFIDRDQVINQ
jgi:hypothetical protein